MGNIRYDIDNVCNTQGRHSVNQNSILNIDLGIIIRHCDKYQDAISAIQNCEAANKFGKYTCVPRFIET